MKTNIKTTVLCYGDSNTEGCKPDGTGRFGPDERWTGILQSQLGPGFKVIEQGLGGRTTGQDGFRDFERCLRLYPGTGIVLLMLGTNDLKPEFGRTAEDVGRAMTRFIRVAALSGARIVLVSPIIINDQAANFLSDIFDASSAQMSRELAKVMKRVAAEENCEFFDAASVAQAGPDGCHMDRQSHVALAEALYNLLISF